MRKRQRKVNIVGSISSLLLAFLIATPLLSLPASALEEVIEMENDEVDTEGSPDYDDSISAQATTISTVNIAFEPSSASGTVTPIDSNGAKAKVDVKATVRVQNSGGYYVYLGSDSSQLKNGTNVIDSVASITTYANMPVNRWGYSFAVGTAAKDAYSAMPATLRGAALDENTSTNIKGETRTYMLSFAANIGADKPAGTYRNSVTMSVVSSPMEITGLTTISEMQEMTADVCAASEIGETKQLKDTRDGKYYWVARLVDGKCWMTQNLDLDLSTSKTLTNLDTDLQGSVASYKPEYTTATTASSSTILANDTGQRSWSLGNYRITNPTTSSACGSKKASFADCPSQFTAYGTPTAANGDVNAHYIVGNFYQWNAATAGTGSTITSGQATSSICPKGWKLPESNTTAAGSFGGLIAASGIAGDVKKLTAAPYYFVRGGNVDQTSSTLLYGPGEGGLYWSSTPYSTASKAYYLSFDGDASIKPSQTSTRRDGFAIRCIAR